MKNQLYIGFDIGGTHVRILLFDKLTQKILFKKKVLFEYKNTVKEEIDENICKYIDAIVNKYPCIKGVALALAAVLDSQTGKIIKWPNNPKWNEFYINNYLKSKYQFKIVFEDDVNSAALGERHYGIGKYLNSFLYVSIGTGIGCGIIYNGNLFKGENGKAGELGHIVIEGYDNLCSFGNKGCLQTIASGRAILNKYKSTLKEKKLEDSLLFNDLLNNDEKARKIIYQSGNLIGKNIGNLMTILDINTVILSGGAIKFGHYFIDSIEDGVLKVKQNYDSKYKLIVSNENDFLGALGAVSLFFGKE